MKKIFITFMATTLFMIIMGSNVFAASTKTVYSLTNRYSGEDIYTTDENEADKLSRSGWTYWGPHWESPTDGTPVYRLWNPSSGVHLYTLDQNEVNTLTSQHGWRSDNSGKPVFYSGGPVEIFRLYVNGLHSFTAKHSDYNSFASIPYAQEGVKLYAVKAYFVD